MGSIRATSDQLGHLLQLVEQSLDQPEVRGAELAARAHLSRFHFDRMAAAALGEPPGAFRRRLLLERAAHQLVTGTASVLDVALAAGYGSPEGFTRAFSRAYGRSPSAYRAQQPSGHHLPAPLEVHFHPPGGLRLPATQRSTTVDVLERMVDHHLWLTGEIVERTGHLDDDVLDRPIELSVEGIDADPTLRSLADRLVGQLEMWVTAVTGGDAVPAQGDVTTAGLQRRLAAVVPDFRRQVLGPVSDGRAEETFVDAVCTPPHTFTYGGVLAHVLTFSAVRRTLAVGALETAGIDDLGSGDPMTFVGGHGADASTVERRRG